MPYFISDRHPDCSGWGLLKEDGELIFCHPSKEAATNHMVAISLEEGMEPAGEYEGETFRAVHYRPTKIKDPKKKRDESRAPVAGKDKFTTEAEALAKAKEIGCEGTHSMDEDGQTIFMPCSTHAAYDKIANPTPSTTEGGYRNEPAPKEDQIEGSDKNKPGSASGAGGDIELNEATETALRNKVTAHNEQMEEDGKPRHTRTTYGQLAAVYRRGAGAFSVSHRPGMTRGQWAMARVNAFLYLLRNGRPENAAYITDNDLLPEGHPKSTRSLDAIETRDVDLSPPSYMMAAARRGVALFEDGKAGDGVTDQTIREARAMANGNVTADKYQRISAWIARHLPDLDAPQNQPGNDGFPGPGAVAFLLWGATPTPRGAARTQAFAAGITTRIEQENEGRAKGKALGKLELRTNPSEFEIRDEGADGMRFTGYAAVFNSASQPLPFTERIAPGAFKRTIQDRNDIKLLWNHDTGTVLGSTRAGTLKITEDNIGLRVEALLPPTTAGKDLSISLRRGDVDAMSFGFTVPTGGDSWSADGQERTLNSVRLHEVSIVPFPAYTATAGTASVRGLDKIAKRAEVDADALADALLKLETGEDITPEDFTLLDSVIKALAPQEPEAQPEDTGKTLLELKKLKLAALMKAI